MSYRISAYSLLLTISLFCGCKGAKTDDKLQKDSVDVIVNNISGNSAKDSIELTDLVRKLYNWRETSPAKQNGFLPVKNHPSDSTYSGMDMNANTKAIQELKETFLFSDEFLKDYRAVAVRMDKELKDSLLVWQEGDLPPFNDDVDEWCNCQDTPVEKYWNILQLTNLNIKGNSASFDWTWGDDFLYKTKATKINDRWKISYLEGFDMNYYHWAKQTTSNKSK